MPWAKVGTLEVATDTTTAALIRTPVTTRTKAALDERYFSNENAEATVSRVIAQDGTVKTAAANAVGVALENSPRIPKDGRPDSLRVRDQSGAVALEVTPKGSVAFGGNRTDPLSGGFRVRDEAGAVAFEITADGKTRIYDATVQIGDGGTNGRRGVIVLMMGQSNGEGRGKPYGPELDFDDPRLLMWDYVTGSIKNATVPLSSQQQQTGLSVATIIGREILATEPPGTVVTIVDAAVGNTGLVTNTEAGVWRVDYAGTNPHLYDQAMTTLDAAVAALKKRLSTNPEVRVFWHQGEADSTVSQSTYAAAFDSLVQAVRAHLNLPDLPVTLGGMVPEYVAGGTGWQNIRAAHVDTPKRLTRTAYADGIPNGGGSGSVTDIVHYAREGVEQLGLAMYAASRRALANVSTSVPVPPLTVRATRVGTTGTVTWSAPFCRVTGHTVQYRTNGGTWSTVEVGTSTTAATLTGLSSGAVEVRVSTTNENGTSAYTTPIPILGA